MGSETQPTLSLNHIIRPIHYPPQTSEHLAAVEIMRLKDIIILQNKIDLVTEAAAQNQHEAIQKFIQGTIAGACGGGFLRLGRGVEGQGGAIGCS